MSKNHSSKNPSLKITDIGHSTMMIQMGGVCVLTDPWFTDPIFGIVTHSRGIGIDISELPRVDLLLISHGHFDHCDLKAMRKLDKAAAVIVPDEKTAAKIRKLGYGKVDVLTSWQSKTISGVCITALPADHPAPECTYVLSNGQNAVFFGGDTRYVKELGELSEKFDLTVALLPINGLRLPFAGKVVMDPVDAAEAAVQLKARTVIPIHYNMSLTIPFLKRLLERGAPGTPEQFTEEVKRRNRHVKVVSLSPGESWQSA